MSYLKRFIFKSCFSGSFLIKAEIKRYKTIPYIKIQTNKSTKPSMEDGKNSGKIINRNTIQVSAVKIFFMSEKLNVQLI
jgi:hypothetical protein